MTQQPHTPKRASRSTKALIDKIAEILNEAQSRQHGQAVKERKARAKARCAVASAQTAEPQEGS